jgi:hypothetical protein
MLELWPLLGSKLLTWSFRLEKNKGLMLFFRKLGGKEFKNYPLD